MSSFLGLSVCFLDGIFHGCGDDHEPEWPPSPLRVFQALVAAAAARSPGRDPEAMGGELRWFERLPAPWIVAPDRHVGMPYRIAVPNNDLDVVAAAWSKGREPQKQPAELKTLKTVRQTWLLTGDTVHFLWPLPDRDADKNSTAADRIAELARSVVSVGWGIDLVACRGAVMTGSQVDRLAGRRWVPGKRGGQTRLRVPIPGTLDDLIRRFREFTNRLGPDGYAPPAPLSLFDTLAYREESVVESRRCAAFSILKPDASGFRPFDSVRQGLTVAGMVRHATKTAAFQAGKSPEWIDSFVLGHGPGQTCGAHQAVGLRRFAYLPVPTIEWRSVDACRASSIRRVLVTTFDEGCETEIAWARRALIGQDLVRESDSQAVAMLTAGPEKDWVLGRYLDPAEVWVTVTPVVLPGYDDPAHLRRRLARGPDAGEQKHLLRRLESRMDGLIRKAIVQAGLPRVLAECAEIEWRKVGFIPGVDLAERYGVPDHLREYPRTHVRILWRDAQGMPVQIPGPICIGRGRFYGIGLFTSSP